MYNYEMTSFLFFSSPEKRVEKHNFLIETTYARTITILGGKAISTQKNY